MLDIVRITINGALPAGTQCCWGRGREGYHLCSFFYSCVKIYHFLKTQTVISSEKVGYYRANSGPEVMVLYRRDSSWYKIDSHLTLCPLGNRPFPQI